MAGRKLIPWSLILSSPFLAFSCALVRIEKPKYSVVEKDGRFELRLYEPCIVAETVVASDFGDAGDMAFRRLYDYISGGNRKNESIALPSHSRKSRPGRWRQ
jgi:hypothetical protein